MSDCKDYWHSILEGKLDAYILPVFYIGFVCALGPWWNIYQFNSDEGLNLATAALIAEGYELYTDIWSDQPPLIGILLGALHPISEGSVIMARFTILVFAAILVSSLFILVKKFEGRVAAWVSVTMLMTSQIYLKNSVSILIGLPAISLAVLAMATISQQSEKGKFWLVILAGVIFGFSLQIKMFTLVMLPVFAVLAYQVAQSLNQPERIKDGIVIAAIAIAASVAAFVVIAVITGALAFDQLYSIHTQARAVNDFGAKGGLGVVYRHMRASEFPLLLLSVASSFVVMFRLNRSSIIPLIWISLTIVGLAIHRPLWKHHLILLIVPMCWLTGCGIARLINLILRFAHFGKTQRWSAVTVIVLLLAVLAAPNIIYARTRFSTQEDINISLERLKWFGEGNRWVFTDMPIDAYRAGLLSPPPLALISEKRIKTGNLGQAELKQIYETYTPSQVSLRRKILPGKLINWLTEKTLSTRKYSMKQMIRPGEYYHMVDAEIYMNLHQKIFKSSDVTGTYYIEELESINALMSILFDLSFISKLNGYGGIHYHANGDRYDGFTQGRLLSKFDVVARPPHSAQQIGGCFLSAYHLTGEKRFLEESLLTASALACSQTESGGWKTVGKTSPSCVKNPESNSGLNSDDEPLSIETVASVLEFITTLESMLLAEFKEVPVWLSTSIEMARKVVDTYFENNPDQVLQENILSGYLGELETNGNYEFSTEDLMGNNPHGEQTTQDLVTLCYSVIAQLANR